MIAISGFRSNKVFRPVTSALQLWISALNKNCRGSSGRSVNRQATTLPLQTSIPSIRIKISVSDTQLSVKFPIPCGQV
jgi:hypothetical protein